MKQFFFSLVAAACIISCNNAGNNSGSESDSTAVKSDSASGPFIKEETVQVSADTATLQCFVAYDENKQGARPIVLVIPEWWGLTDYPKSRARELAQLGYFAVAVDMYGNGAIAADPQAAMGYAGKFYSNTKMSNERIQAALTKAFSYSQADSTKTAAIGFCFGGSMVLNAAKSGMPFDGVVSFHGGLQTVPPAKGKVTSKILVCHGAADSFVPEKDVKTFRKQLDDAGIPYTFKEYANAKHAFTNPMATEMGQKFKIDVAYNEEAAKAAWSDMQSFFSGLW